MDTTLIMKVCNDKVIICQKDAYCKTKCVCGEFAKSAYKKEYFSRMNRIWKCKFFMMKLEAQIMNCELYSMFNEIYLYGENIFKIIEKTKLTNGEVILFYNEFVKDCFFFLFRKKMYV